MDETMILEDKGLCGTVLNNLYKIETQIGKGTMGTVYLATHKILGNKWAVKWSPKRASMPNTSNKKLAY